MELQQLRPEDFNDDALGRALDKLSACGQMKKLFSSIALTTAATHKVPIEGLHVDTTSISVQGAYEGGGGLDITFGFSKDRRPDLKQFLIGLVVNSNGLPLLAQSLDGNTSDKSWKKGEQPLESVVYHAHIEIEEEREAMAREKDLASTFVLITNLMDTRAYPDREILKEYKEQNAIERQFRSLKQPFLLGPIFLKESCRENVRALTLQPGLCWRC